MTTNVEEFLDHFGTKGMKWGVRRAAKREARKDANWADRRSTPNPALGRYHGKTTQKIINDATKAMKPEIKALNKKEEYNTPEAKLVLKKDRGSYKGTHPISVKYKKEVSDIYMQNVKNAAAKHLGISPSGKWKESLVIGKDSWDVQLKFTDEAEHASISDPDISIRVRPIFDDDGYIVDFELFKENMAQTSVALVEEFLDHYGTKGMKWGVRQPRGDRSAFKARAKSTDRTKFEKSPKRISSAELEKRIRRMEMEKKYNELNKRDVGKGEQIATEIMASTGKKIAITVLTGAGLFGVKAIANKKLGPEAASMITKRGK
ncbi:MAG: hypothetical protein ABWY25_06460 [Paenisporosarcina sp.]